MFKMKTNTRLNVNRNTNAFLTSSVVLSAIRVPTHRCVVKWIMMRVFLVRLLIHLIADYPEFSFFNIHTDGVNGFFESLECSGRTDGDV